MLYAARNAHLCRWRESAVEWNQVFDTPRWRCPYPGMQSPAEAEAALAAPCSGRHGALHTPGEGGISYMICYDVPESGVPEGYHRPAVPAVTLAVLPTRKDSPREQVQGLWKRTLSEWFPTSGYERAECPELGMYFGIDGNKHNYCAGIWIRVARQ